MIEHEAAGAGLVIIDPEQASPQAELSPLLNRGDMVRGLNEKTSPHWHKTKEHFITAGVPFDILPPTDVYKYDVAQGATVECLMPMTYTRLTASS